MKNAPDYKDNLVFAPKSADDLNKQERQSDVIISAIERCERLEAENQQLKELLKECREILDYAKDFAYHDPCCKCIAKINQILGEK